MLARFVTETVSLKSGGVPRAEGSSVTSNGGGRSQRGDALGEEVSRELKVRVQRRRRCVCGGTDDRESSSTKRLLLRRACLLHPMVMRSFASRRDDRLERRGAIMQLSVIWIPELHACTRLGGTAR